MLSNSTRNIMEFNAHQYSQPCKPDWVPIIKGLHLPEDLKAPSSSWNIILSSIMGTIRNIFQRKIAAWEIMN